MWVLTKFLEISRHTHNMERSICGPRPTVLSASLYQSCPLTILFLAPQKLLTKFPPKTVPSKVSTECSPNVSTKFCKTVFFFHHSRFFFLSTLPNFWSTHPSCFLSQFLNHLLQVVVWTLPSCFSQLFLVFQLVKFLIPYSKFFQLKFLINSSKLFSEPSS